MLEGNGQAGASRKTEFKHKAGVWLSIKKIL